MLDIILQKILWLVFAHFLGDYALESVWMMKKKHRDYYILFAHSMIWSGVISIALLPFGSFALWKFAFLLVGHLICDYWKCKVGEEYWPFDQLFHFFQIILVGLL